MADLTNHEFSWDRVIRAVERVKERLLRATALLEAAQIPYAVVGGNAVAAWVTKMDESAVRVAPDVAILINRENFKRLKTTFEHANFFYRDGERTETFLDGPGVHPRHAVHVLFAGEKVRPADLEPAPTLEATIRHETYRVASLQSLVRMSLSSYRIVDQVYLRDLLDVGLIDAIWPCRFPPELGERLQVLIDNPEG